MNPTLSEYLSGRKPTQVGMVVPDIKEAVSLWSPMLGKAEQDWSVYTYSPNNVRGMLHEGSFRLAMTDRSPQIEFIEHLDGDTIYSQWMQSNGFGLHHLGFHVEDIISAVDLFSQAGLTPIHQGFGYGVQGDGGFAYYDIPDFSGVLIELIESPQTRRSSETL